MPSPFSKLLLQIIPTFLLRVHRFRTAPIHPTLLSDLLTSLFQSASGHIYLLAFCFLKRVCVVIHLAWRTVQFVITFWFAHFSNLFLVIYTCLLSVFQNVFVLVVIHLAWRTVQFVFVIAALPARQSSETLFSTQACFLSLFLSFHSCSTTLFSTQAYLLSHVCFLPLFLSFPSCSSLSLFWFFVFVSFYKITFCRFLILLSSSLLPPTKPTFLPPYGSISPRSTTSR